MMAIEGRCVTNVEGDDAVWPTTFVAVPRIGEKVRATNGVSLKVVSITHEEIENPILTDGNARYTDCTIPAIIVELGN